MVEFKLTIGDPKTKKTFQRTVSENAAKSFIGLKIGDTVKGEAIDLTGYEFQITGGSDFCGFPMRKGIVGVRKRILAEGGVGFRKSVRGLRKRKTVCGEIVSDKISQINLKVLKHGSAPLAAESGEKKEEAPKAEAPKEAAPEKKEAPKEAAPKEEKKEEKPKAEVPKEETPKEKAPKEEKPKGEESK